MSYSVGDSIAVLPRHSEELVQRTLSALAATGDEMVVDGRQGDSVTLRELLTARRNITRLQKATLKLIPHRVNVDDKEAVKRFAESHELWDALEGSPVGLQPLVDTLPPILPRFYSIASSPLVSPRKVELTIAGVRYEAGGHPRAGVCTEYLCKQVEIGERGVPVYIQPSATFRLPEDGAVPIIMVGPGTGVAPFRAFMQEREARGATGRNWLFFGDRNRATDYLYEAEWERWQKMGLLRLSLAFSRDQVEKVYVQQRMREQGADVWTWLEQGAYLYVCGNADRMAPDVEAALLEVIALHGARTPEAARLYLKELRVAGRYLRDVY